jgi:hypothetical protein
MHIGQLCWLSPNVYPRLSDANILEFLVAAHCQHVPEILPIYMTYDPFSYNLNVGSEVTR